jgi:hypothetical protein
MPADTTPVTPPAPPAPPGAAPDATQRCILDIESGQGRLYSVRDPISGKYTTYVGGGFRGRCRGQDITIESDSVESYDQNQMHILIGNVRYREPRVAIDAQRATYFRAEERIVMEVAVHAVMVKSGATLDGPRVEYFRAVRNVRDRSRFVATARPMLTYVERDSAGQARPPLVMRSNSIISDGDSTYFAIGRVELIRTDLVALGDSAYLDASRRFARLMKEPVIESKGAQPYTLRGRVIDLFGATGQVDRVLALDSASAVSKEFTLRSDTIDLRVRQNQLERAFAFGPAGARATTTDRDVVADSLDILMPNQRIRELRAIGKAYAESAPDTARMLSEERDWLRGDTVVTRFDSLPASDTTSRPRIRELVAAGNASALYQVPPDSGGARGRPGINYVRGGEIRLEFAGGEVATVTVKDKVAGVYLEPRADTAAARRPARPPARPPRPGVNRRRGERP